MLCAALRQRTQRLALEVDNDGVPVGGQYLAEVVIAMVPCLREGRDLAEHCLQPLSHLVAADKKRLGETASGGRALLRRQDRRASRWAVSCAAADPGSDIVATDRLRPECWVVCVGFKRGVHFRGTPAQPPEPACGFVKGLGTRVPEPAPRASRSSTQDQPSPSLADKGLQYREGHRPVPQSRGIQVDPAEQGRGSRETRRLGQESAYFELGVHAALQLSDHLQDRGVADRGSRCSTARRCRGG